MWPSASTHRPSTRDTNAAHAHPWARHHALEWGVPVGASLGALVPFFVALSIETQTRPHSTSPCHPSIHPTGRLAMHNRTPTQAHPSTPPTHPPPTHLHSQVARHQSQPWRARSRHPTIFPRRRKRYVRRRTKLSMKPSPSTPLHGNATHPPNPPPLHTQILKLWEELGAFEQSLKLSEGRPEFTFYDGPPFATGLPHYGTCLYGLASFPPTHLPPLFEQGTCWRARSRTR